MIVCFCHAITDREYLASLEGGKNRRRGCQAGSDCGACQATLRTLVEERRSQRDTPAPKAHANKALPEV